MKDSGDGGRIKVVDRRRIDGSGEEKDGAKAEGGVTGESGTAGAPPTAQAPAQGAEPPGEIPQVDFVTFILSFSQTAFLSLGLGPHPETGQSIQVDLTAARWTIDALEMLHSKTHGNLTGEEERIFEMLLAELRMAFVQVATAAGRRSK